MLDGDSAPVPKGHTPNFWLMSVVTKQLDGWMSLGTDVDLGLGHIVLDRDPAPPLPETGTAAPLF